MLKKSIKYTDFNDQEVTEDFYFHLSKADLIHLEMSHKGGLKEHMEKIMAAEDTNGVLTELEKIILMSYGRRSDDGARFVKTETMREEFRGSEAYSELLMELLTDATKAGEFINGIVPRGLDQDMAKVAEQVETQRQIDRVDETGVEPEEPRILTTAEIAEMDANELKLGLATGRFKLS